MPFIKLIPILMFLCPFALSGQVKTDEKTIDETEFLAYMSDLSRLAAKKPFLKDSPDVYLEPKSLNHFFTENIYKRLEGNAYFGYRYDEGFICNEPGVSIEDFRDLTGTNGTFGSIGTTGAIGTSGANGAAYRLALEQALNYPITPKSNCQIGICVIGVEPKETEKTLPGVMVEAYLRNASTKKSFFIRYGAGSPRGLAAAIRLSALILAAELEERHE